MRLTLIALSASYCVDALLAISTSTKASSHSCEAARRSVMTAVSGRTALAAAHRPRATIICRDGFFDSVTGQCNARVMHVHCHRVHRTRLCCSLGFGGRAPVLPPCSGDGCAAHMCMCMCRCRSLNTTPSHSARPTRAETRETRSRSTPYLAPSNTPSCDPPTLMPLRGGTQLPAFAARMSASITAELDREWIEQARHALYAAHAPLLGALYVDGVCTACVRYF